MRRRLLLLLLLLTQRISCSATSHVSAASAFRLTAFGLLNI
jgi:hypothetical protein